MTTRTLTHDEKSLLQYTFTTGAATDFVRKAGRYWTWEYNALRAPQLYHTKRDACGAIRRFVDVLFDEGK